MTKDAPAKQKPRRARPRAWLKDPRLPREEEAIGGGYFVFRRGDGTNRIRPSNWPFEHPTLEAAKGEALKLARSNPGYQFEVFSRCFSIEASESSAEAAA